MNNLFRYLTRILPILLLGGSLFFASCFKTNVQAKQSKLDTGIYASLPLATILANNPDFSDFDTLLKKSGLYQRVTGGDSAFTLLIPTNEAFASSSISFDSVFQLSDDSLRQFVGYHILAGSYPTAKIPQSIDNPFTTLSGQTVYFSKPLINTFDFPGANLTQGEATLNINGIRTNQVDLAAQDSIYIQELAAPLSPPYSSIQAFLSSHAEYSYFVAALQQFNLWNKLDSAGPYTIYAPVNTDFINQGVTLDMIQSDTFNASHFQAFFVSAGILPGRIFGTDFTDAANNNVLPAYYSPQGFVEFNENNGNPYYVPGLVAYNYTPIPYGFQQIGGNPNYLLLSQPAVNGVIYAIDDLLVYPQYVYIGQ